MDGFIDHYYRDPSAGQPYYQRGAIVWLPSSFLMDSFFRLTPDHYNPAKKAPDFYTAKKFEPADLHKRVAGLFHHAPVYDQELGLNEEFVIQRMKLRKGVIFSAAIEAPNLLPADKKRVPAHWYHDCFVVLPIYTLEDAKKNPKFPARFIEYIKAYAYPQMFHLKEDYGKGMRQSAIRFDRMQIVHKQYLQAANVWLSEDILYALDEWFRFYVFGELDEQSGLVAQYRKTMLAKLAPSASS